MPCSCSNQRRPRFIIITCCLLRRWAFSFSICLNMRRITARSVIILRTIITRARLVRGVQQESVSIASLMALRLAARFRPEELGWVVAVAVLLHKIADGASTVGVMLGTQHDAKTTMRMLIVAALAPLAGTALQSLVTIPTPMLALTFGWFAGVFLYLGGSSLLPAAHESGHSRWLPLATLAGVAFTFVAQRLAE